MTQARPKTTMSHGLRAVPQCLLVPVLLWQGVSYADRLFVGSSNAPGGPRHGPHLKMQRQAAGETDLEERRAKCPLTKEQLESDHGEKWEDVRDILVGLRAPSPEAIMRARFTALKFQDPQFLAATEKDESQSIRERNKQWSVVLGLEEMNTLDKLLNMNNDAFNLQEPVGFEVISTDGEWVEFKIKCSGKTLEEKSRFIKDRKYGWVYGGETEYSQWV